MGPAEDLVKSTGWSDKSQRNSRGSGLFQKGRVRVQSWAMDERTRKEFSRETSAPSGAPSPRPMRLWKRTRPGEDGWPEDLLNYREEIEGIEDANRLEMRSKLPNHYSAVLHVDGIIGQCISYYQTIAPPDPVRTCVVSLANRAHANLLSGWHLTEIGAYGPAAVLTRALYEDWISLMFYQTHPTEAPKWWDRGQSSPDTRELDFGKLKERLVSEHVVPESEKDVYKALSSMAHPSADSAMASLRPPSPGVDAGLELRILGRYFGPAARHSANLHVILGLRIPRFFRNFPKMDLDGSPVGKASMFDEFEEEVRAVLKIDDSELLEKPMWFSGIGRRRAKMP